jgi:hypothetical protein
MRVVFVGVVDGVPTEENADERAVGSALLPAREHPLIFVAPPEYKR